MHHIFPQQYREDFAARGVDHIDDYTIPLDAGDHGLIHQLGYNDAVWGAVESQEESLGRLLTADEAEATVFGVAEQFGLSGPFVPYDE